jgi:hypothetical protein
MSLEKRKCHFKENNCICERSNVMVKKLLILMLVLGMTSAANATLSWSTSAATTDTSTGTVVHIVSDDDQPYPTKWIDDTAGSLIDSIVNLPAAGTQYVIQDPSQSGFTDFWTVEAAAFPGDPDQVAPGNQFAVTFIGTAGQIGSTYTLFLDTYGSNDALSVTVIPEPTTIALLSLGGLFLRRRK